MFINIITFSSLSQQLRHQWSWESLYYTGTSSSGKQRRVFNTFILKIIIAESQQPIIPTRISHMSSSPRLRARKKRVWQSHFANMQRRRKKGWFMQVVAFIFLCRNCPCVPFFLLLGSGGAQTKLDCRQAQGITLLFDTRFSWKCSFHLYNTRRNHVRPSSSFDMSVLF